MNAAIRVVVAQGAHHNAEGSARYSRENGGRLGAAAGEALSKGEHGVFVGLVKGEVRSTPLEEVPAKKKLLDSSLLELA
jgi:6-phosphofructokinase 1